MFYNTENNNHLINNYALPPIAAFKNQTKDFKSKIYKYVIKKMIEQKYQSILPLSKYITENNRNSAIKYVKQNHNKEMSLEKFVFSTTNISHFYETNLQFYNNAMSIFFNVRNERIKLNDALLNWLQTPNIDFKHNIMQLTKELFFYAKYKHFHFKIKFANNEYYLIIEFHKEIILIVKQSTLKYTCEILYDCLMIIGFVIEPMFYQRKKLQITLTPVDIYSFSYNNTLTPHFTITNAVKTIVNELTQSDPTIENYFNQKQINNENIKTINSAILLQIQSMLNNIIVENLNVLEFIFKERKWYY